MKKSTLNLYLSHAVLSYTLIDRVSNRLEGDLGLLRSGVHLALLATSGFATGSAAGFATPDDASLSTLMSHALLL